jgi:hypothetical protein
MAKYPITNTRITDTSIGTQGRLVEGALNVFYLEESVSYRNLPKKYGGFEGVTRNIISCGRTAFFVAVVYNINNLDGYTSPLHLTMKVLRGLNL